jgi:predicted NBD/HSP70 family sugar kinase
MYAFTVNRVGCASAGEYLMALPQQLEVLMGDEAAAAAAGGSGQEAAALQAEAAEGDELAAEWLDRVSATLGVDVALVALWCSSMREMLSSLQSGLTG